MPEEATVEVAVMVMVLREVVVDVTV